MNIGDIEKTAPKDVNYEEESALALNKGGQGLPDWIPGMEAKLVKLQSKWSQILSDTAKQEAFGWPADECAVVTDAIDSFTAAREAYSADKTKENRGAKEKAKKASVKAMRYFAKTRVRGNDLMSAKDKLALGILFLLTGKRAMNCPRHLPGAFLCGESAAICRVQQERYRPFQTEGRVSGAASRCRREAVCAMAVPEGVSGAGMRPALP